MIARVSKCDAIGIGRAISPENVSSVWLVEGYAKVFSSRTVAYLARTEAFHHSQEERKNPGELEYEGKLMRRT
jgi:hypothetical protein